MAFFLQKKDYQIETATSWLYAFSYCLTYLFPMWHCIRARSKPLTINCSQTLSLPSICHVCSCILAKSPRNLFNTATQSPSDFHPLFVQLQTGYILYLCVDLLFLLPVCLCVLVCWYLLVALPTRRNVLISWCRPVFVISLHIAVLQFGPQCLQRDGWILLSSPSLCWLPTTARI